MEKIGEKILTVAPWSEIEEEARKQIKNTASLPFIFKWIAVMPDCHYGKGATVGTVMATKGAIVPAAVGVDIGCGMIALQTSLHREDLKDLHSIRQGIERRIPMSAGKNNSRITESAAKRIDELKRDASQTGTRLLEISPRVGAIARHSRRRKSFRRSVSRRNGNCVAYDSFWFARCGK